MKLVIVESPTKSKTLSRYLGKDYQILASMGHLRDLPKKKLGVDTEKDFKPTYINVPGKAKTISQLKETAKKAKIIILATDPDREGEAIAFHVAKLLRDKDTEIQRIVFHEITRSAIENAISKPGKINMKLFKAQQARRVLDRLVGYKLSPLLWKKIRRGLSAGRVQSPAVRLIVEKEREIKAFKPEEFWKINVDLENKKKKKFSAELKKIDNKNEKISHKKSADKILKDLKSADFIVDKIISKDVRKSPPPPFITSTLQRTAHSVFRWSAKKTMREAQRLYENGYITYHRTDSVHLAIQAVSKARKFIVDTYGKEYLVESLRTYKVKSKLAQEAHEAIRPTRVKTKLEILNSKLGADSLKLYKLIYNRFLATQMESQLLEKNIVNIIADKYLFRAEGEREKFAGFRILYGKIREDKILPELEQGEKLKLLKINPEQKFTQPPSQYSEGSLIKALEERGIGRPSTYAPIISTIQMRQYVEKIEGFFHPTHVGETVCDFLIKYFQDIVDYDFTAEMENDLDAIALDKKDWVSIMASFYKPFSKKLKSVEKNAKREKIKAETIGKKCPLCKKGEQVIRVGRFGKFLSCSKFPDCKWKSVYVEKLKGVKCLKCGADIVIRKTRKGKRFFGCSTWPKCKWASWRKPLPVTADQKKDIV
ncbi:type I DNA topoisomerase [Patescibacteria group bacterium]